MEWRNKFTALKLTPHDPLPELLISNLTSWKVITVTGDDKKSYLQGQLTCDLISLNRQESTLAAHCNAKGKVWSLFRCFHHQGGYALFQHASAIDTSLAEIKKYSVFSKVDINISQQIAIGVLGSKANEVIDNMTFERGNVRTLNNGSAVKVDDHRWILLIDESDVETLLKNLNSGQLVDDTIWDKFDIENGLPRVIKSIQNTQIPQAFNLQATGGISFNKGCYMGQEIVARAKYRGTNKRSMYIVKGQFSPAVTSTFELERKIGESWRSAGTLFAHYRYTDGTTIGLIILPNNLEPKVKLRLTDQPSSIWQISKLPYNIEE